jgi:hypothetical protein
MPTHAINGFGSPLFSNQREMEMQLARYEDWLNEQIKREFLYAPWMALDPAQRQPQSIPPQPTEEKRTGMNYSTAVFLINNEVRAVKGVYQDEGNTAIFKTLDKTIKKDDLVVVPTTTRHKMTVFKITETDVDVDMDSQVKIDWIIQKVDEAPYKVLLEQENDAIQKIKSAEIRKKRTELREALFKDQEATLAGLALAHTGDAPAAVPPPAA